MSLGSIAEDYFSSINPIARRMYEDMRGTKLAYEDLWDTISEKEQKQILSESIILPEISIKYPPSEKISENQEFAVKFIIDDNCSYRDEHSGPFSFKTRSQRDLTLFAKEKVEEAPKQKKKMPIMPKLKERQECVQKIVDDFMDVEVTTFGHQNDINSNENKTLPKTGLDFLDNW